MNLPVLQELRLFEPWNQPEHARLLAEPEMILEAYEAVGVRENIFLSELNGGVGLPPRARVAQAHRLHRPEAQSVHAAPCQLLNRQARLEPTRLLEPLERDALGAD